MRPAVCEEVQNLVVNPSFELGQEGKWYNKGQNSMPADWQKQSGEKEGGGHWEREQHQALADIAHFGKFYMRGFDAWQTLVQKVSVKPSQRYEFSCHVKTDVVNSEGGNTFLWIIYYDKDGKEIMPYDYGIKEATGTWLKYSRLITSPPTAAYLKILLGKRLSSSGTEGGGSVCFDDVELKEIPPSASITYYRGDKLYLFNNITIPFEPTYSSSFKDGVTKNVRIIFEVQEGIEIKSIRTITPPDFTKIERKEITKGGKKDVVYIAYCPEAMTGGWGVSFYMTSTCKPGETRYGYLWTEWEGGKQEPQVFAIETLKTEEVIPPKRFLAGTALFGEEAVFWPDFCENYRKLGMNFIDLWEFPTILMADWQNPSATCASREPGLKEFVERCKKEHLNISGWVAANYSGLGGDWPAKTEEYLQSLAIDINGKTHLRNLACPSYRGPGFEKLISSDAKLLDYGFTWLEFDDEEFTPGDDNVCFDQRCKDRFKGWLAKKYPDLEYMDPSIFERNAETYEKLHKAWWDFKSDMIAERYDIMTTRIGKQYIYLNYLSYPSGCSKMYDYEKMANSMQYILPMLYHVISNKSPNWVGDETYLGWKQTKGKAKIVPAIGCYEANPEIARDRAAALSHELKYVILEAAASGGKGFIYWPGRALDGLDWKYMAEAIRIVGQIEDIVMEGTPSEKAVLADAPAPGVRVRCVQSDKGTVVMVSEYSDKALHLKVRYETAKKVKVIDVDTGAAIADISPENPVFTVSLDKERARIFKIQ